MTSPTIAVLDYGNGSFDSVIKSLQSTGARVEITANYSSAMSADGLLIAGLADFTQTMLQLKTVRAAELIDARLIAGKPVLATGVAFQVLFEKVSENNTDTLGLSQWPGVVEPLAKAETPRSSFLTLDAASGSKLLAGVEEERFYFAGNDGVLKWILDSNGPLHAPLVSWTKDVSPFVAVVENGPLAGTQFQPETSAEAGIKVLANWINSLGKP
jgi:glutamine amidotransferase